MRFKHTLYIAIAITAFAAWVDFSGEHRSPYVWAVVVFMFVGLAYIHFPPSAWRWHRMYFCLECGAIELSYRRAHEICGNCGADNWTDAKGRYFWHGLTPKLWAEGLNGELLVPRRAMNQWRYLLDRRSP